MLNFFFASGNTDSQHTDSLQDSAGVGWDERSELYYQAALLRKSEILSLRNHTLASSIPLHDCTEDSIIVQMIHNSIHHEILSKSTLVSLYSIFAWSFKLAT